jgi:large subunit ribosomal protein L21
MYAVIRTGGKQYRVAPGDVIRIETRASADSNVEFGDVLAVSGGDGQIGRPSSGARVVGQIIEQGQNSRIPLQTEETVQEDRRPSAAVHFGSHYGDCL